MQKLFQGPDLQPSTLPISHRVGAPPPLSGPAARASGASPPVRFAALRSLKSGTLMIIVATTFALLSAALSLLRDDPAARHRDSIAAIGLRGSLPAIAGEPSAPTPF